MIKQETFTDIEYSCRKKKTRREEFPEIMDEWVKFIEPYYPKGKRSHPPMGEEQGEKAGPGNASEEGEQVALRDEGPR